MEANNFRLFEVIDETIRDIYGFFIRYFRTLWILLISPKKLNEFCEQEQPFLQIVRPFNFILVSFILFGFGIELIDYESISEFFNPEEGAESEILKSLVALDGTTLVIKFLPFIVLFIIISKLVEFVLNKIFKTGKSLSIIYLYGVGYSTTMFFVTIILMNLYDEFMYSNASQSFDGFVYITLFLFVAYLAIYPSFLMTRSLKYAGVKLFHRSLNFVAFLGFNFLVIFGFVFGFFFLEDYNLQNQYEEGYYQHDLDFNVFDSELTDTGLLLTIIYKEDEYLVVRQNSEMYLSAETDSAYYSFYLTARYLNVQEQNGFAILRPNTIYQLQVDIAENYYNASYATLDSLFQIPYTAFATSFYLPSTDGLDAELEIGLEFSSPWMEEYEPQE